VVQTEAPQIDPTGAYTFSYWQLDGFQQSGNPIQITMDKPHTATASFVPNAVTITTTSSGVRTYTSSITTTVIATGVTASTSTVTQVGTQTASTFLTTTIISGETGTFATTAAQTFTSTVIDTQLKNPNLELLYGSVVTVSVLIIATPIASRALSRKQIVCSKCGFRNPPTAPSFCVNCGESLKGSRV
jgi:ribosomal protein L40E